MSRNRTNSFSIRTTWMWMILVLLFAANQGGIVLWQAARTYHYQQRALRTCRDTLTFDAKTFSSNKDISWVKDDEIVFEGRMFDVKRMVTEDDVTMLIGHFDEDDDMLFKWLAKLTGDDAPDHQKIKFTCWDVEATIPGTLLFQWDHHIAAKPSCRCAPFTLFTRNTIPPSPPPQYC